MKNILLLAFLSLSVQCHAQIITTIAGIGTQSFSGDGGPAVDAGLDGPYDVAIDGLGNYYISDGYNNRIRKVNAAGIITTIAGNGTLGYNGDGIPATAAQLYHPVGITFDHYGNLYFTDAFNNRVRKINISGVITTVAGNGNNGYNGDNILADSAAVYDPHCIALDAHGNLYITDWGNHRIRKVNTSGIITTIAGTGTAGYTGDNGPADAAEINEPYGIAVDDTGNIYFADSYDRVVRKIDTSGIITTFAGGGTIGILGDNGPADSAWLSGPGDVTIDSFGNVYIDDVGNQRIRKVTIASGIITTIVGNGIAGFSGDNGLATNAEIDDPGGMAFDATGNLYFADFDNNVIRRVGWPESINQLFASTQQIIIYPNPAATSLTIRSTNELINDVAITNLIGQTVYLQSAPAIPMAIGSQLMQVDVSMLPSGVYFIKVNENEVGKFVKL